MDYSELKSHLTKEKITVKQVALQLGFSNENNFKPSFESGALPFSKVPLLCQLAHISPNELFDWDESNLVGNGNYASHISGGNTQNSNESIQALREELKSQRAIIKEKDKQINRLLVIIERNKLK